MKYLFLVACLMPAISFADFCKAPWEQVPSPTAHVKTCRLSVPHGWLVFNFAVEDVEIPQTLFYPDENHEWIN